MATLSDIVAEKKRFFDSAEDKFKTGVNALFAAVPELKAIEWNQYTPAFNDGEPCEHRLCDVHFLLDGSPTVEKDEDDDDDYDDEDEGTCAYGLKDENISEESKALLTEFSKEFDQLDDVLYKIFGTNQKIRVNRDGNITVEEYDCGY